MRTMLNAPVKTAFCLQPNSRRLDKDASGARHSTELEPLLRAKKL